MKPKKHLGQNFLQDKAILGKIVGALAIQSGETVLEIGPGHGELTEALRIKHKECGIIAVEKDERLAVFLKTKFKNDQKIKIVAGDALKILPSAVKDTKYGIQNTKYKVAGNIPYYITGHLLRVLSELNHKPERVVLTVQKEVAERLCAVPPKANLLAASVQFWAKPEIVGYIGRGNFHPAPKVDSAIIKITPHSKEQMEPRVFYPFIQALFRQPRKTVLNNLTAGSAKWGAREELSEKLKRSGVSPSARPQDLALSTIIKLARGLKSAQND